MGRRMKKQKKLNLIATSGIITSIILCLLFYLRIVVIPESTPVGWEVFLGVGLGIWIWIPTRMLIEMRGKG